MRDIAAVLLCKEKILLNCIFEVWLCRVGVEVYKLIEYMFTCFVFSFEVVKIIHNKILDMTGSNQ